MANCQLKGLLTLSKIGPCIQYIGQRVRVPSQYSSAACSGCNLKQQTRASSVHAPRPAYGGRHTVTMLPGDGVGPELMNHVKEIFRYAGVPVDFEEVKLDGNVNDESDLENALLAIQRNRVAIKGNISSDFDNPAIKTRNMELRSELDLFANIVRCRNIPGIATRHQGIDIAIIRENTEGEYSALEHEVYDEAGSGIVESLKIITEKKSRRIAEYAFQYAARHNRKKVTAVHKANIMKLADGLFLECCREVSKDYPNIEFEGMIVDNCSMQMVSKPQQFDVMVLPNLYGNIIANIGAGLVGGPGVVPGVNIGQHYAVFETGTRNTGKNIEGKNIANPAAMLLASADMLYHLGLKYHGRLIRDATYYVLSEEKVHTPDIGGLATTMDTVHAIKTRIHAIVKDENNC